MLQQSPQYGQKPHAHSAALAPAGTGATAIALLPIGGSSGKLLTPLTALFTTNPTRPAGSRTQCRHPPTPNIYAMLTTTPRPSRVRFATGATAEQIQARRDAAALTEHRKLNGILNALQGPFRLPGH
jgi:hypothetical protein